MAQVALPAFSHNAGIPMNILMIKSLVKNSQHGTTTNFQGKRLLTYVDSSIYKLRLVIEVEQRLIAHLVLYTFLLFCVCVCCPSSFSS